MKNPNRVLVSEDTSLWQGIFARLMTGDNAALFQAFDLETTLRMLDRYFFNVVIVDLALDPKDESRLDGLETIKRIGALREGTQAIVLTGKGTVNLAVSTLRDLGAYHFLEKEKFDEAEFLRVLGEASEKAYRWAVEPGHFRDPAAILSGVNWQRFASILKLPMDDVIGMFSALLRESQPVRFRGERLEVTLDETRMVIQAQCWSKWHGKAIRVAVGGSHEIMSIDPTLLLERRDLDTTSGAVIATDDLYESYAV